MNVNLVLPVVITSRSSDCRTTKEFRRLTKVVKFFDFVRTIDKIMFFTI